MKTSMVKKTAMRHDAAYVRCSTSRQAEEGTSVQVQIEQCEKVLGGSAVHYVDAGCTGRTRAGRPSLQRLLDDARAGRVGRIAVWRFSRLGRNLADAAAIIQTLEDLDVEIISANEGSEPLARSIFLAMADHYSRELASNTRDGLKKKFEQGSFTGGPPPYGYTVEEADGRKRLVIDKGEATQVCWMFERCLAGDGYKAIAGKLTAKGVKPRRASCWTHTSVRAILLNAVCTGRVQYNRRRFKLNRQTGNRVPVWRDDAEVMQHEDETLRLVSDADFQVVQAKVGGRKVNRNKGSKAVASGGGHSVRALTGLLTCGDCGGTCYTRTSNNRKGSYTYLTCGTRYRTAGAGCGNQAVIREDKIVADIIRAMNVVLGSGQDVLDMAVERALELAASGRDEAARIRGQLRQVDSQAEDLMRMIMDKEIEEAAKRAFIRKLSEAEGHRDRLQAELGRLVDAGAVNAEEFAQEVRAVLGTIRAGAKSLEPKELREIIAAFVGPMRLLPDGKIVQVQVAQEDAPAVSAGASATGDIAGARFFQQ